MSSWNNPFAYGDVYSSNNPFANIGGQPYQYSDSALVDLQDAGLNTGNITTQPLSGGNMAFPWMAAATVAAPIIGGLFQGSAERQRREAGTEALGFQAQVQQDMATAGFGAQELARDNEYRRQLNRGMDILNLRNSSPALAAMRRDRGYGLAGTGLLSAAQITKFGDMFGGY